MLKRYTYISTQIQFASVVGENRFYYASGDGVFSVSVFSVAVDVVSESLNKILVKCSLLIE